MPADPIVSRPYHPGEKCCEACVFGSGQHAEWCVVEISENDFRVPFDKNDDVWIGIGEYDEDNEA